MCVNTREPHTHTHTHTHTQTRRGQKEHTNRFGQPSCNTGMRALVSYPRTQHNCHARTDTSASHRSRCGNEFCRVLVSSARTNLLNESENSNVAHRCERCKKNNCKRNENEKVSRRTTQLSHFTQTEGRAVKRLPEEPRAAPYIRHEETHRPT